jgi:TPR repeat protein
MKEAADLYVVGAQGVPVDKIKADLLYKQAAMAGNEDAKGVLAAQIIATAFGTYTADKATSTDRADALKKAQTAVGELGSIGASGLILALVDSQVQQAIERLTAMDSADPMRMVKNTMIERLITQFRTTDLTTRTSLLADFSKVVADTIQNLADAGEHQRVVDICKDTFKGIKITDQTSGERDRMVKQLSTCVTSLYVTGYRDEAAKLADESFVLTDTILSERPWDWYLKDAVKNLGWSVGKSLAELGEQDKSQKYLQRAWNNVFMMFGRNDLIGKYPFLPLKGAMPNNVIAEDKAFFERFIEDSKSSGMKRFTIPIDFDGIKHPFYVYVVSGKQGYKELQDQFIWMKEYRGGQIPNEVANSFNRLNKIAVENNVDFLKLCVYAMGEASKSPI